MSFIYLASPYTHRDPEVVHGRFKAVEKVTAILMRQGHVIYSPIVHSHAVARRYALPLIAEFWRVQNYGMLSKASALWVLALDECKESVGVFDEIRFARQCQIPLRLVSPYGTLPDFDWRGIDAHDHRG